MNKHFVFKDDSWWDQPGCDCCPATLIDCYNCTSHPEIYYSCRDIYEPWIAAICLIQFGNPQDVPEVYWDFDLDELEQTAAGLGITVEIIE